ncbi:MAG: rhamnan synthesis F family protein [Roseovarius sp.]|nr:rhamnan synthesis F family protein [Roseovarius sp.]
MLQTVLRKASTVLRYLFPGASDRAYLAKIRASGLFDRRFYLTSNPRLHPLFRIWPERHYIQLGERNGTCPNPGFSPRAYVFHNPDLVGLAHPFLHYLDYGRDEGRMVLAPLGAGAPGQTFPDISATDHPQNPAEVAVVMHIYYPDFWPEIAARLSEQTFPFDLYVTITDLPATEDLTPRIRNAFPEARVWRMPNLGRDILPFVHLVNSGVLRPYRAVCKLHSKKSPHRTDGEDWRQHLIAGVLGAPAPTRARLAAFLDDEMSGVWVADGQAYHGDPWWGSNRPRAEALMARAGLSVPQGPLGFAGGSIYWVRGEILSSLARLRLAPDDFEPEQALVDGTTAHAVERMMGWLTKTSGLELRETSTLGMARPDPPS